MTDTSLFTTSEARAFDNNKLADEGTYATADITAAELRIRADFIGICGVAFFPTTQTDELYDGDDTEVLVLKCHNPGRETPPRPVTLVAASIEGTDLTASELSVSDYDYGMACYSYKLVRRSGLWTAGNQNVKLTYVHGYASVPGPIKRAAELVLLTDMMPSDISRRATNASDGEMSYTFLTPGANWGFWYPIPEVNAILGRFAEREAGIA